MGVSRQNCYACSNVQTFMVFDSHGPSRVDARTKVWCQRVAKSYSAGRRTKIVYYYYFGLRSFAGSWTEAQESAKKSGESVSNLWLNIPEDKLAVINRVVGLLRNGSLFSLAAAAHKIYGVPQTINTANHVYFLAYPELAALRQTVWRCVPISSSSSDSGLGDDSPTAEKADFPDPIIPDYDLDIVVTVCLSIAGTTWTKLERGTDTDVLVPRCSYSSEVAGPGGRVASLVMAGNGGAALILIILLVTADLGNAVTGIDSGWGLQCL
ncbi:hypothetical protein F4604DRAFT_1678362 [Suillus subluteus]|nr:hypothetical protein F4604DRAFT_1678362 [Suillus subluteus]